MSALQNTWLRCLLSLAMSAPAGAAAQGAIVEVAGLGGARSRSAEIRLRQGSGRGHQAGFFPEAGVYAEARPHAVKQRWHRGFFARLVAASSIGQGAAAESGGLSVDALMLRAAGSVGWLSTSTGPLEVGPELGIGYDAYLLGENPILPSAEYVYPRAGLRLRLALAQHALVAEAEVGYRAALTLGALSSRFGSGRADGLDVGVGLRGDLQKAAGIGLSYGVSVGWVRSWLSFADQAAAQSGTEESFRVAGRLGWVFP